MLDNVPNNISTYIPLQGLAGDMLQSCFDNVTVLPPGATSTGNSTGGLDFSSQVNFGSVKPLNEVDEMLSQSSNRLPLNPIVPLALLLDTTSVTTILEPHDWWELQDEPDWASRWP